MWVLASRPRWIWPSEAQLSYLPAGTVVSVADPGCLSRIPDPYFYFLLIPDPGSNNSNKREGWKKIFCHTFLCCHKFHKIEHYFSFEVLKKKIWANFKKLQNFLPKKLSPSSQKYGFGIRDPRSGIGFFRIPNPGSRGQKGTGSRIRIRNTNGSHRFCFPVAADENDFRLRQCFGSKSRIRIVSRFSQVRSVDLWIRIRI